MRIHTKIVIDIASNQIVEDIFYNYEGKVSLCKGGSGSQTSTINTNTMPDWAQSHVTEYLDRMYSLSINAYQTYTGITYAVQNDNEKDGITALAARGRAGHPIITKGETYLKDTLDTLKFNINPKINAAYLKLAEVIIKNFAEDTLPRLNQDFNLSGNYGDDSHHWAQAKAAEGMMAKLQDIGMDIYFKDYLMERDSQVGTFASVLQYGGQDVLNAETLRIAGLYSREFRFGILEDAYKKWHDEQTAPDKRLNILETALKTVIGSNITETSPYYRPSTMSYIAGFALAGMGAYGQMQSAYLEGQKGQQTPSQQPQVPPASETGTGQGGGTQFV